MKRLPFFSDCVNWPPIEQDVLTALCNNGQEIARETFLRRIDRATFTGNLFGATLAFTLLHDRCTHFYSYKGIYWFEWSAIEYVFASPSQIVKLRPT